MKKLKLLIISSLLLIIFPSIVFCGDKSWLLVPGKNAGPITEKTSEADLKRIYGKGNVIRKKLFLYAEGDDTSQVGTVIFPKEESKKMEIIWKDIKGRRYPERLTLEGRNSVWKTAEGVSLGTTLEELEQLNGKPFTFLGLGWDYGGSLSSWENGHLSKTISIPKMNMVLCFPPQNGKDSFKVPEGYEEVTGDKDVISSHKVFKELHLSICQIFLNF